jgi:predicted DNA-binding transcriptional regulator AlpA
MTAVVLTIEPLAVNKKTAAAMLGGMSVSTLETLGRTEQLLQPVALSGRLVGYKVENLRAWLRTRPASTHLPPENCHFGQKGRRGKAAGNTDGNRPAPGGKTR